MTQPFDSQHETKSHIKQVGVLISKLVAQLGERARNHDASKLKHPEKAVFDKFTPLLRASTYDSPEYKEHLAGMGEGLKHHYDNNTHHPEHFENGVDGMSLLDVLEMLADWKAASERHWDGDFAKSLELNRVLFHISDQLYEIMVNTALEMKWITNQYDPDEMPANPAPTEEELKNMRMASLQRPQEALGAKETDAPIVSPIQKTSKKGKTNG